MVLPGDRYAFSKKNRHKPDLKIWIVVIFVLLTVIVSVFFTLRDKDPEELPDPLSIMGIEELWEKKEI